MESDTCETRCAPCYLQEKVSNSYCFCIECLEHLCETCSEQHNKFKVTRGHKVLKGNDMPTDLSSFTKLAEIGVCMAHQERRIEYKCLTHQEFACSVCVKSAHRSCVDVEDIDQLHFSENDFRLDFLASLDELNNELEKSLLNKAKQLELLERNCAEVTLQRSKFLDELRHLTADLENDATKALDVKTKLQKEQLTACIEESGMLKVKLMKNIELANTVLNYGSYQQQIIVKDEVAKTHGMVKNALKLQEDRHILLPSTVNIFTSDEIARLRSMKSLIEEMLKDETKTEVNLLDDKENATATEGNEEKTTDVVNSCDTGASSTGSDEVRCEATSEQAMETNLESASNYKITEDSKSNLFESDLRVGLSFTCYDLSISDYSRKSCNHIGSILYENEKMVFLDGSNYILKLVSSDFRVISYQKLDDSPYDLVLAGNNKVVVAVGKSIQIFTITTDDRFVQNSKFLTKNLVYSVCPVGDNLALLYSALEDNTPESSVQIRQLNNHIKNNIYSLQNEDGNIVELLTPEFIRSRFSDEIIVSEGEKLLGFDLQGRLGWDYEHIGANIELIAFDSEKNIYYSDGLSHSIYQISLRSFKKNRILIPSTGVKRPCSLLINSKARTTIVGFYDNNAVHVYEFC